MNANNQSAKSVNVWKAPGEGIINPFPRPTPRFLQQANDVPIQGPADPHRRLPGQPMAQLSNAVKAKNQVPKVAADSDLFVPPEVGFPPLEGGGYSGNPPLHPSTDAAVTAATKLAAAYGAAIISDENQAFYAALGGKEAMDKEAWAGAAHALPVVGRGLMAAGRAGKSLLGFGSRAATAALPAGAGIQRSAQALRKGRILAQSGARSLAGAGIQRGGQAMLAGQKALRKGKILSQLGARKAQTLPGAKTVSSLGGRVGRGIVGAGEGYMVGAGSDLLTGREDSGTGTLVGGLAGALLPKGLARGLHRQMNAPNNVGRAMGMARTVGLVGMAQEGLQGKNFMNPGKMFRETKAKSDDLVQTAALAAQGDPAAQSLLERYGQARYGVSPAATIQGLGERAGDGFVNRVMDRGRQFLQSNAPPQPQAPTPSPVKLVQPVQPGPVQIPQPIGSQRLRPTMTGNYKPTFQARQY